MEIIDQIQSDLLDPNISLSNILRKAKVLASQLENVELGLWASQELDGYKNITDLPDYRIIRTSVLGEWTNGVWFQKNRGLPLSLISDMKLRERISKFEVLKGIRTVEQFSKMEDDTRILVDADTIGRINTLVGQDGFGYSQLYFTVGSQEFEQLLDTVRNRLLDFILRLSKKWKINTDHPKQDEVNKLVSVVIYNNPEGGTMTVFDQREQNVKHQFNFAGDAKFESAASSNEVLIELRKLLDEVTKAVETGTIDDEKGVDVEAHVKKAILQAEKPQPNKQIILENIEGAKKIISGVTAAAGLVNLLFQAAEAIRKFF